MFNNASHVDWNSKTCVLEAAAYIKSKGQAAYNFCQNNSALHQVAEDLVHKVERMRNAGDQGYHDWITLRHELLNPCQTWETTYLLVWVPSANNSRNGHYERVKMTREERLQREVEHQTALARIREVLPGWPRLKAWEDTSLANKKVENLQGLLDLMLQKVQAGADLTPFIELIVEEGKPQKTDPHYVSDDVINTAFLLYAYSIPTNRADKVLKYTDGKYAARVRFAAASAAAQFSKAHVNDLGRLVANEPSGRLTLNETQRNQILSVFQPIYQSSRTTMLTKGVLAYYLERVYEDAYSKLESSSARGNTHLAAFAPAIALSPTLAEMLAAEASAYAASIGMSLAEGTAALQTVLAAPSTAVAGEVLVVGVPIIIFGVALDDAFAPTYRTVFENKLRESLRVETIPSATVIEDAYTQAFDGTYMVETLTNTRTEAATKTQVQQTAPCIHQYSSQMNVMCPSFEAIPLQGTFIQAYTQNPSLIQSKFITGGASQGALRLALTNPVELAQLEQIWQERCSFMTKIPMGAGAQITRRGFVRATYYAGRWIPTVETSIMTGVNIDKNGGVNDQGGPSKKNLPMKKFLEFIKSWTNADLTNLTYGIMKRQNFKPQQVGDVWVRNGIHQDRSKPTPDHIHIEKICAYTPGSGAMELCQFNPTAPSVGTSLYQCNLSLQYK